MTITFMIKELIDKKLVSKTIEKRIENTVQGKLDAMVLSDSNFFCPHYSGTLQKSGIIASVLGSGRLTWNAPYAWRQYYKLPNKSLQHNPNATGKWFESAKAKWLKKWEKFVNDEYRKNS